MHRVLYRFPPEECDAASDVDGTEVGAECNLKDGTYECECTEGAGEFVVDDFCELDDDVQEIIVADKCIPAELPSEVKPCAPTFIMDDVLKECSVRFDCVIGGGIQVVRCSNRVAPEPDSCTCFLGADENGSFDRLGFCNLANDVRNRAPEADDSADDVLLHATDGCGFKVTVAQCQSDAECNDGHVAKARIASSASSDLLPNGLVCLQERLEVSPPRG